MSSASVAGYLAASLTGFLTLNTFAKSLSQDGPAAAKPAGLLFDDLRRSKLSKNFKEQAEVQTENDESLMEVQGRGVLANVAH
jgi:hypothetical protein